MLDMIAKEATKRYFGKVWDDIIGYLRIYDHLKLKTADVTGKSINMRSVDSFWYSILGDRFCGDTIQPYEKLRHGNVIKFKNVFLSEWAPKLPGRIWTFEGLDLYTKGQQHVSHRHLSLNGKYYEVLNPYGKEKVVSAGFGSIRIKRKQKDCDNFMYMGLVGESNCHCDYAIPVIVSKSVYRKFLEYSEHGAPWLKSVEGVLHINDDLPFGEFIPKAIGASLSVETESTLKYRAGLPKCYLHITSPLSIKPTYNSTHPDATAWTMFQTSLKYNPYSYTYITFTPNKPNSMDEAVNFINQYVKEYNGKKIITDFDGMQPRLQATIPIDRPPLKSKKSEVKKLVDKCNQWITARIKHLK